MKILYIPCPIGPTAKQIATIALEKKMAFCAHVLPTMISHYVWNFQLESEREVGLVLKTFASFENPLKELIKTHHPYSVPAILSFSVESLNSEYTEWAKSQTQYDQ